MHQNVARRGTAVCAVSNEQPTPRQNELSIDSGTTHEAADSTTVAARSNPSISEVSFAPRDSSSCCPNDPSCCCSWASSCATKEERKTGFSGQALAPGQTPREGIGWGSVCVHASASIGKICTRSMKEGCTGGTRSSPSGQQTPPHIPPAPPASVQTTRGGKQRRDGKRVN